MAVVINLERALCLAVLIFPRNSEKIVDIAKTMGLSCVSCVEAGLSARENHSSFAPGGKVFPYKKLKYSLLGFLGLSQYKSLFHAIQHFGLTPALRTLTHSVGKMVMRIVTTADETCGWGAAKDKCRPLDGFARDPQK